MKVKLIKSILEDQAEVVEVEAVDILADDGRGMFEISNADAGPFDANSPSIAIRTALVVKHSDQIYDTTMMTMGGYANELIVVRVPYEK